MKIAVTGHTSGLGQSFYNESVNRGHTTLGFSRSNGYDLRDYSVVERMLKIVNGFDIFINNAKPDYAQAQILYRLVRSQSCKTIVSIGSAVITSTPAWSDTFLLEYVTQKIALAHANQMLSNLSDINLILLNPIHLDDTNAYAKQQLDILKL